jgi:hypothetical protein
MKDIDSDGNNDYSFEILELSPNIYAARIVSIGASEFLDNSTFGYPDSLNYGDSIVGYFNSGNGVLGTFNNAGQFNGAGNKYLGIRVNTNSLEYKGWIELNCSANNDTLTIISCGYNTTPSQEITAGQTSAITAIKDMDEYGGQMKLFPNPCSELIYLNSACQTNKIQYSIHAINGEMIIHGECYGVIDISNIPEGVYIVRNWVLNFSTQTKLVISR